MKAIRMILLLGIIFSLLLLSACKSTEVPASEEPVDSPVVEQQPKEAEPEAVVEEVEEAGEAEVAAVEEEATEIVASDTVFPGFAVEKIDPAVATGEDTELLAVSEMIYSRLVESVDGELVPGLAASWSLSDDELTYEFRLRPDVVFTDGTKVTSDVILANFNRWFDPENPLHGDDSDVYVAWKENFLGFRGEVTEEEAPISLFDGIEKVDNLVFLIHLNTPMANFPDIISGIQFSILNPILMAAEGNAHATKAGSVVGTGAYQVDSWDDAALMLKENDTYYGMD